MQSTNEIFEELEQLWEKFRRNHDRYTKNNVKKCGVTARKTINEIRKLSSAYRMKNLEESRNL
jgi:hypothetical protein